jgi:hypothetical protein
MPDRTATGGERRRVALALAGQPRSGYAVFQTGAASGTSMLVLRGFHGGPQATCPRTRPDAIRQQRQADEDHQTSGKAGQPRYGYLSIRIANATGGRLGAEPVHRCLRLGHNQNAQGHEQGAHGKVVRTNRPPFP